MLQFLIVHVACFRTSKHNDNDSLDNSIFYVYVCIKGLVIIHNFTSLDQQTGLSTLKIKHKYIIHRIYTCIKMWTVWYM